MVSSSHKLSGTFFLDQEPHEGPVSISMGRGGYFHAVSEVRVRPIQFLITPFDPRVITKGLYHGSSAEYQFSGTDVGFVRWGRGNAEGAWRTWTLRRVDIFLNYFSNGVSLRFGVFTHRGAWTDMGAIVEKTRGSLDPLDFDFELFIDKEYLPDFLWVDKREGGRPGAFIDLFMKKLEEADGLILLH